MAKVVFITGCSSGFGYLAAKHLAEHGYIVYAAVRQTKDLNVFQLTTKDYRLTTIQLDVTWPQAKITGVVKKILAKEGRVDVLVNNAGFGFMGAVSSFTVDQLQTQFDTNFFGTFKVTQAVLPSMRTHHSGMIINISSFAGLMAFAYNGIYSSSKFALEAMTTALRYEEAPHGIAVTSINPGMYATRFHDNTHRADDRMQNPLKSVKRQDPTAFAHLLESIIQSSHPKANYLLGLDSKVGYLAMRLLPKAIQEWLIRTALRRLV